MTRSWRRKQRSARQAMQEGLEPEVIESHEAYEDGGAIKMVEVRQRLFPSARRPHETQNTAV